MNPPKDKTLEFGYSQDKSQVETLIEKMRIIESSDSRGNVDLASLTNFLQAVMPPKFKAIKFVKYDDIGDPCAHLHMFCRKIAPYGDNHPLPDFP